MLLKMFEMNCRTAPPEEAMAQLRKDRPHLRNSVDVDGPERRGWDALPLNPDAPPPGPEFDYSWTAEDLAMARLWRDEALEILLNPEMKDRLETIVGRLAAPLEFHINLALETYLPHLEDWQARQEAGTPAADQDEAS